ncbi:hypothetical protein GCM10023205_26920 [Yinghuangia aomiensis]|uniref:NodB homology domain-containing protein n=1 Tax=Yinghuangia aomiensis TaxID=676205 RepID=A0ABP9H451_9ACTN
MAVKRSVPRRRIGTALIGAGILAAVPSLSACASSDKAADAPKPPSASAAAAAPPGPDRCAAGYVALTFDDGPTPMTSAYVQALAAAGNTRATFFLTGAHAEKDPGTVRALVEAGHAVGNHSYSHPYLDQEGEPKAFNELLGTNQIVKSAAGSAPTLFRPPFGRTNAQIRDDARRLGMTEVLWTTDSFDYKGIPADEITRNALAVQPGGVILLHEGYPATAAAIPAIVKGLADRGLCTGKVVPSSTTIEAWPGQTHNAVAAPW